MTPFFYHLGPRVTPSQNPVIYPLFPSKTLRPKSAMLSAWRRMMSFLLMAERRSVQARKARQKLAHLRAAAGLNPLSNSATCLGASRSVWRRTWRLPNAPLAARVTQSRANQRRAVLMRGAEAARRSLQASARTVHGRRSTAAASVTARAARSSKCG